MTTHDDEKKTGPDSQPNPAVPSQVPDKPEVGETDDGLDDDPFSHIPDDLETLAESAGAAGAADLKCLLACLRRDSEALQLNMERLLEPLTRVDDNRTLEGVRERLGQVGYLLSELYQSQHDFPESRHFAEGWRRFAAVQGHADALIEMTESSMQRWSLFHGRNQAASSGKEEAGQSASEGEAQEEHDWLALAFDAVLRDLSRDPRPWSSSSPPKDIHKLLQTACRMIRWRERSHSRDEAFGWLERLLPEMQNLRLQPDDEAMLRGLRDDFNEPGGLWVLDGIVPSEDRAVKWTLQHFQPLCQQPTPLAPPPEVPTLVKTLDEEFPWFAEITRWVAKRLSVASLGGRAFHLPPLLLLGDPGIGKTVYAQRLASLL